MKDYGRDFQGLTDHVSLWTQVPAANYTATPASTSTITMGVDMTASIKAGMSLRYTSAEHGAYYGRVGAITANLLTVNGPAMDHDITKLEYGGGTLTFIHIGIPGLYEDASSSTLILSDRLEQAPIWNKPTSYCVYFSVWSNVHDSTTHGSAGPLINGSAVCSTAAGLTIAANATKYETIVNIDPANYDINFGEPLEIGATKNGAGDASDLTTEMIFVTP